MNATATATPTAPSARSIAAKKRARLDRLARAYRTAIVANVEAFQAQEVAWKRYGLGSPEHIATVTRVMETGAEVADLLDKYKAVKADRA